jgi:hypothetical protein
MCHLCIIPQRVTSRKVPYRLNYAVRGLVKKNEPLPEHRILI